MYLDQKQYSIFIYFADNEEVVRLYHNVDNTREYHEMDPQFLEIDPDHAPAIEDLCAR